MNADTGEIAAIRDEVSELDDHVDAMTVQMVEILALVVPILRAAATRERQHNDRSDQIRHGGRHRRRRPPPRCTDDRQPDA